jgi:thioredoxin
MATIDLTEETFGATVEDNGIVLVDFWAAWCGPCRQFAPTFTAASEKHPSVVFGKVDTEAEQRLSSAAGISSIPTLMGFRDGILVFSQPGALPPAALEQLVTAIEDLDMDDVRRRLAESEDAAPEGSATA